MATSDIEKVLTTLQGIDAGDANLATKYIHPQRYIEHNPHCADGLSGLRDYVSQLTKEDHYLKVIRTFQDGPYVFAQTDGLILGQGTFFDIFRFEDGLIVEHWVFSAKAVPPNKSGHTQIDGPTDAKHIEATEKNKSFMRDYYQTFHIAGKHDRNDDWFAGDVMIRHEPGVRDGLQEFLRDVEELMKHRTIDEVKFLLGQGDFVFIAGKGTHEVDPCLYIDLYRVEDEKIVEHWGFPEQVPTVAESRNNNGVL